VTFTGKTQRKADKYQAVAALTCNSSMFCPGNHSVILHISQAKSALSCPINRKKQRKADTASRLLSGKHGLFPTPLQKSSPLYFRFLPRIKIE
jgi:hypothetical protein